jgi:drug/metabolite transporter (DMT)-like permease
MMSKHFSGAIGLLVLATLLWSGNYIAGRYLASVMPAFFLNGLRWLFSALLFSLVARAKKAPIPLRQEAPLLLMLGLLGMFFFSSLTYLGLRSVPAAQAGMISGLIPISILLFSAVLLGERPTGSGWVGVLLAVLGVGILMSGQMSHLAVPSIGDWELIGAALSWGAYTALGRRYRTRMSALSMTAGAAIYGAVPSLIVGLISLRGATLHFTPVAWLALVYVGTAASVLAYWSWNQGVMILGAARSAPFINLLPVFTVILGILLLHESVSGQEMVGGAVTLIGAFLSGLQSLPVPVTTKSAR